MKTEVEDNSNEIHYYKKGLFGYFKGRFSVPAQRPMDSSHNGSYRTLYFPSYGLMPNKYSE